MQHAAVYDKDDDVDERVRRYLRSIKFANDSVHAEFGHGRRGESREIVHARIDDYLGLSSDREEFERVSVAIGRAWHFATFVAAPESVARTRESARERERATPGGRSSGVARKEEGP